MIYLYESEDGEVIEKDFPMNEDHPDKVEENGKIYSRKWNVCSFHIPMHMQAGHEFKINDNFKGPSGKKHFY